MEILHKSREEDFIFKSKYIDVLNSKMHYTDEGKGPTLLFIHGMPSWSYVWRHMISELSESFRCVAVDLIGMGKSDKPDIAYRVFDHINYIENFITQLNLKDITLVMHGWGSVPGFTYAMRHENNVKGLVFLEAQIRALTNVQMLSLPIQELKQWLNVPDQGYDLINNSDFL